MFEFYPKFYPKPIIHANRVFSNCNTLSFRNASKILGNYEATERNCTHKIVETVTAIEEANPFGYVSLVLGLVAFAELLTILLLLIFIRHRATNPPTVAREEVFSPMQCAPPSPRSQSLCAGKSIDVQLPKCHTLI